MREKVKKWEKQRLHHLMLSLHSCCATPTGAIPAFWISLGLTHRIAIRPVLPSKTDNASLI